MLASRSAWATSREKSGHVMARRSVTFSLLLFSASLPVLSLAPVATSAAQLCFGQSATIVGALGESIVGTEGPDVVLTNGADRADLLGGDDLLCLTGESFGTVRHAEYLTGPGEDRIDSSKANGEFTLDPGPDSDEV